jgi:hypothetical protein
MISGRTAFAGLPAPIPQKKGMMRIAVVYCLENVASGHRLAAKYWYRSIVFNSM